ncbi:MAG: hypothetical protein ACRD1G_20205, partial [Acidimicrobiales bacterium]
VDPAGANLRRVEPGSAHRQVEPRRRLAERDGSVTLSAEGDGTVTLDRAASEKLAEIRRSLLGAPASIARATAIPFCLRETT